MINPRLLPVMFYRNVWQQRKVQGMMLSNPLLGSALTMPKRKRGRPRKLSGSSTGNDFDDYESRDNLIQVSFLLCSSTETGWSISKPLTNEEMFNLKTISSLQGSPELLEVKMGTEGYSEGSDENNRDIDNDQDESIQVIIDLTLSISIYSILSEIHFNSFSLSFVNQRNQWTHPNRFYPNL